MSELTMLQIGKHSLAERYSIPDDIEWIFFTPEIFNRNLQALVTKYDKDRKRLSFNMVIVTDLSENVDLMLLDNFVSSYAFFYTEDVEISTDEQQYFFKKKMAKLVTQDSLDNFMVDLGTKFFSGQYGESIAATPTNYQVNPMYQNSFEYEGNRYIVLEDDFGEGYYPIISAIYNLYVPENKKLEIWLEYVKDEGVDIKVEIAKAAFSSSEIRSEKWDIEKDNLRKPAIINSSSNERHYYSVNIFVKGRGKIKIGQMHQRWTRIDQGFFINGGKRIIDQNQEEIFYYFDPGDMKPPLNIYFSGYKSVEGFEGYFMLKKMKSPFILVTDTRLEGGGFYLGSKELENKLIKVIQDKVKWLGFSTDDLILSGISMGAFGAMYYGLTLKPHAIILGKPLLGIGDIALNGRLHRPNEFDTVLDVMLANIGENNEEAIEKINSVFWDKFAHSSLKNTVIYAAYMKEDDYDPTAFYNLTHKAEGIEKVVGHGYTGRHNDDSPSIVKWFLTEYQHVLNEFRGEKR